MTNPTTENFWQAWNSFEWPEPVIPSYRLYYNNDGSPKCYSMEHLPDKYIEVDAKTFALSPQNVQVVDGKLIVVDPPVTVQKLQPNHELGIACHPQDVCIIVSENQPHTKWNKQINETY
jgi:hypothetical protein